MFFRHLPTKERRKAEFPPSCGRVSHSQETFRASCLATHFGGVSSVCLYPYPHPASRESPAGRWLTLAFLIWEPPSSHASPSLAPESGPPARRRSPRLCQCLCQTRVGFTHPGTPQLGCLLPS